MQLEVLSFAGGDLEAGTDDHITSIARFRQQRLGRIDRGRSENDRGIRARRDQAPNEPDQRTRSGRDRRARPVSVRSAVSGRARAQSENETRLGTKRRFSAFAAVAPPDRGEDDRLPEVHGRGPPFRRHVFCSRSFTTSGCARFPASSAAMSRSILVFATATEISALAGKELQRAYIENARNVSASARSARVRETRAVADLLSPSYFIQAQIFPYNYQDVIVRGNATRINALFLREYFRQRHSIPEMPMARGFEGGYTDIFFTGVARNVWHCDVASLYPSIMLQFDCFPATDQLQIFRHLLTDLRTFRLEAKAHMRDAKRRADSAASSPRAAKHIQDSDQQFLRLSRFRAGAFCRFRCRRARHPNRPRSAAENDRLAEGAGRAGDRGRHRRHLFRPACIGDAAAVVGGSAASPETGARPQPAGMPPTSTGER